MEVISFYTRRNRTRLMMCTFVYILLLFSTGKSVGQSLNEKVDMEFARYPGGIAKFEEYIQANLKFPTQAFEDSIAGEVLVQFSLNDKGEVKKESIVVVRSLCEACDREAIRLIENSPAWLPARSKDKDVEQDVTFPIRFIIQ